MEERKSIFQRPLWVSLFALTSAVLWGWAYTLIKLGFAEFGIEASMTGSKMLFAGIRFAVSGLIILALARASHRNFSIRSKSDVPFLLLFTLFNTTLHYAFFYIGLSHCQGARAAIMNSMSVFLVVIMACMLFKSDKMSVRKVVGCVLGFTGILTLNMGGKDSGTITLLGDGMIVLNAFCGALASLMTRGVSKRVDVFVGTGYSLAVGGALLIIAAFVTGGTLPIITPWGVTIMLMLIGISTIAFGLYNKLLSCNPVGKVAIFNSLTPVVGTVTSCICLGETFYMKYIAAGALATAGIYIINKGKK